LTEGVIHFIVRVSDWDYIYVEEYLRLWLRLFSSFVVVVGSGGFGAEPSCDTFALTEVRNSLKQETHLSNTSTCTSYHSETMDTLSPFRVERSHIVALTTIIHLVQTLKIQWNYISIPPLSIHDLF
jgi:hypothetical protein